jgi:hypothetical protein
MPAMSPASKEYSPPRGGEVVSVMARCIECAHWWSHRDDAKNPTCPCGGRLLSVDMEAHVAALPDGTRASSK